MMVSSILILTLILVCIAGVIAATYTYGIASTPADIKEEKIDLPVSSTPVDNISEWGANFTLDKMGKHVFKLPDVGEGVVEGEIRKWNVKPGDTVKEDEPLVELMTDIVTESGFLSKATITIPSTVNGKVVSTTGKPGDMIPVGSELIVFEVDEISSSELEPKKVSEVEDESSMLKLEKLIERKNTGEITSNEFEDMKTKIMEKKDVNKESVEEVQDDVPRKENKDSVVNKSNIGAGGKSKAEEIKEIKELLDSGAIDDDEFKQMKKEILRK